MKTETFKINDDISVLRTGDKTPFPGLNEWLAVLRHPNGKLDGMRLISRWDSVRELDAPFIVSILGALVVSQRRVSLTKWGLKHAVKLDGRLIPWNPWALYNYCDRDGDFYVGFLGRTNPRLGELITNDGTLPDNIEIRYSVALPRLTLSSIGLCNFVSLPIAADILENIYEHENL